MGHGQTTASWAWATCALLVSLAAGCGESTDPATVAVVNAWNQASLRADNFEDVKDESLGKDASCKRGRVSGLEAMLCRYPDAAAAVAAREAGLELVGETTGLALPAGQLLLIVADRDGADPSGRTINQIARVFRDSVPRDDAPAADTKEETPGDDTSGAPPESATGAPGEIEDQDAS